MIFYNKTRLQTLFWEIKTRFCYIAFSLFLSFVISYKKSVALLYLFVLSYQNNNRDKNLLFFVDNFLGVKDIYPSGESYCKNTITVIDTLNFFCDKNQLISIFTEKDLLRFSNILDTINISSIKFIFTDIEEAFSSSILICFIFSFVFGFLHILYSISAFFAPSLYHYETKKWTLRATIFVSFWLAFIISFQNVIIPKFTEFLLKFQIQSIGFNVEAETKIYSYCTWASTIFLIGNSLFLMLSFIIVLLIDDSININFFIAHRKWCAIVLLLLSALIAPPELLAQFILVFFFFLCFELLIYFFFLYKNLKRLQKNIVMVAPL